MIPSLKIEDQKIQYWMKEALLLAHQAALKDEVPIGAVVVDINNFEIVGRGYNLKECLNNPIFHAEILAIQDACQKKSSWRLLNCILVTTLEPCFMCLGAIQQSRLLQVFYGAQDLKGGALSLNYRFHEDSKTNHRFDMTYFPTYECSQILKDFFLKKRMKSL